MEKKILTAIAAIIGIVVGITFFGFIGVSNYKGYITKNRYQTIKAVTEKWQKGDCAHFYETTITYRSGTSVTDAEMATLYEILSENCVKNKKTPQ